MFIFLTYVQTTVERDRSGGLQFFLIRKQLYFIFLQGRGEVIFLKIFTRLPKYLGF